MKKNRLIKWLFLIFSFIALLIFIIVFYITFTFSKCKIQAENESDAADTCLYHVIVTGTYENLDFLQKVYDTMSVLYVEGVDAFCVPARGDGDFMLKHRHVIEQLTLDEKCFIL